MLSVIMVCHYAECHYAKCGFTECHYAQCRNAKCHNPECRHSWVSLLRSVIIMGVIMQSAVALSVLPSNQLHPQNVKYNRPVVSFAVLQNGRLCSIEGRVTASSSWFESRRTFPSASGDCPSYPGDKNHETFFLRRWNCRLWQHIKGGLLPYMQSSLCLCRLLF